MHYGSNGSSSEHGHLCIGLCTMKGEEHHLATGAANLSLVGLDLLIQALPPVLQFLASSRHAVKSGASPVLIVPADRKLSRNLSVFSQSIRRPEAGSAHMLQRQGRGAHRGTIVSQLIRLVAVIITAPDSDPAPC